MSRPFNGKRYKALLEGLEISELKMSQLTQGNAVLRVDPEYFSKTNLLMMQRLTAAGVRRLGDTATVTDGIHSSIRFVEGTGIKVFSAKHPKANFLESDSCEEIDAIQHAENPRTCLREGDVLISTVGTIGNAAVVPSAVLPANSDRHVGIIRLQPGLPPLFLSTFLVGAYGRFQTVRESTGNVQLSLFISKIAELLIPCFSSDFMEDVSNIVRRSESERAHAQQLQQQAEATLLSALGLDDWSPPEPLTYVRKASEVFAAGRVDAEFYSPARVDTLGKLRSLPAKPLSHYCQSVRELLDPTKKSHTQATPVVRNFDLSDALHGNLTNSQEPCHSVELGSTKKFMQRGDIVISRLRSYLKQIAVVRTEGPLPVVGSTEFIVLRLESNISPELIATYLRCFPVQKILQFCQEGNQHPRFDEKNLLEIPIPNSVFQSEVAISVCLQEAHAARGQAEALLEQAKRAVEIAIEEGEQAGIEFLQQTILK